MRPNRRREGQCCILFISISFDEARGALGWVIRLSPEICDAVDQSIFEIEEGDTGLRLTAHPKCRKGNALLPLGDDAGDFDLPIAGEGGVEIRVTCLALHAFARLG